MRAASGGSAGCCATRGPRSSVERRLATEASDSSGGRMYPHQSERLSEALERAHLGALVATSPENVAYITGFQGLSGGGLQAPEFGVFSRAGTALVVPAVEASSVVA